MNAPACLPSTVLATVLFLLFCTSTQAQLDEYNEPPISYETAEVDDAVAQLARKLEAGEIELDYNGEWGYLEAVLDALDIPASSQTLVFSKTSLQRSRIAPRRPRAIYFNDDVYVGYCQNGDVLELAAADPQQGAIFYTLDQSSGKFPKFIRDRGHCLSCHASHRTQKVPGFVIRSVFPNESGTPEFGSGTFTTDHTSPFTERWGGWYVTGTHGDMRHMGNTFFNQAEGDLEREAGANRTELSEFLDTDHYLTGHSDIVALMVLEHQTQMHNAFAWASYENRRAVHLDGIMNKALDRPDDHRSDSTGRRIASAGDNILKHLLFTNEFALTSPVQGTSSFTKDFAARGPFDSQGRSLRQFDLKTRMFKYPCSFLIYSRAFDALPQETKTYVTVRLHNILTGKDDSEDFAHLTPADRQAILEILQETKPDLWVVK
ncbi:hypothetical protein GYB59_17635 [bacterium]|nr:hypothetical protein [bacterium]